MHYNVAASDETDFFCSFSSSFEFFDHLSLLFVLTQKVTKRSRLDLFAKKRKFLLTKFLNLRGNESCASIENYSRASNKRNFHVC